MQDDNRINFENWDLPDKSEFLFFSLEYQDLNEKLVFQ
jgi:hypothetical protein